MKHIPIPSTAKTTPVYSPVAEQLRAAQELIRDPEHWCQGEEYRDILGKACNQSPAAQRCSIGALIDVGAGANAERALIAAAKNMGWGHPERLNDATDHATVMKMFDRAIEKAEAEHV